MFKADTAKPTASKSSPGTKASRREHDGSSAESGDSEIEQVSEEPPKASNKVKTPVKTEEDRPSKPKPPTAAVPPEVRLEKPQEDNMHKHTHEAKGDLGKPGLTTILEGFNKQKAIDLLYWRNVKQSGAVFSSVLLLLFSLTQFSVVSVGAYLALAALSATISFRIYKSVLQAVQKTDEGHPFKAYLEMEIALSQDQISKYADKILLYTNTCMKELRRLFLVQDLVDSLKFAVLMWLLTYVGALFNGLTLLILAVISMFTMPVVYEKHQAQIDQYVGLIRTQVNSVVGKIQAKIPGAKRKEE
uniref:Reticulon n=1 Tax=Mastacembelus armatus TaxID=205130 RepID=A0A7N8WIT7_9TELE